MSNVLHYSGLIVRLAPSSNLVCVATAMLAFAGFGCSEGKHNAAGKGQELLNVSYDPTRELWRDLNTQFIASYEKETGNKLRIKQSHGGSSTQARAVIDGLD